MFVNKFNLKLINSFMKLWADRKISGKIVNCKNVGLILTSHALQHSDKTQLIRKFLSILGSCLCLTSNSDRRWKNGKKLLRGNREFSLKVRKEKHSRLEWNNDICIYTNQHSSWKICNKSPVTNLQRNIWRVYIHIKSNRFWLLNQI